MNNYSQSLDTRPRSIYDVLDCSAAEAEPTIEKTNSKKREMLKTVNRNLVFYDRFTIHKKKKNIDHVVLLVFLPFFPLRWSQKQNTKMKAHLNLFMRTSEANLQLLCILRL